MTLTVHAIIGAGVATAMTGHPVAGAVAAFASHFVLDAIPHWDYKIYSDGANPFHAHTKFRITKHFLLDVTRIGGDAILGVLLVGLLYGLTRPDLALVAVMGAIAAILPDFLQFVYRLLPRGPIAALQRFHQWFHATANFNDRPFVGVPIQVVLVLVAGTLTFWLIG